MTGREDAFRQLIADEVGVLYARFDDHVLTAHYGPVWRPARDRLVAVGLTGTVRARRRGRDRDMRDLAGPTADRDGLQGHADAVLVANHCNWSFAPEFLLLPPPLAEAPDWERLGPQRDRLLAELADKDATRPPAIVHGYRAAQARPAMPASGRLALSGFDGDAGSLELLARRNGQIVALSTAWLERVSGNQAALALLGQFMRQLLSAGHETMVCDIATRDQLKAALSLGASYVSGDLLGPPRSVGRMSETIEHGLDDLLADPATVLPFTPPSASRRMHQFC